MWVDEPELFFGLLSKDWWMKIHSCFMLTQDAWIIYVTFKCFPVLSFSFPVKWYHLSELEKSDFTVLDCFYFFIMRSVIYLEK